MDVRGYPRTKISSPTSDVDDVIEYGSVPKPEKLESEILRRAKSLTLSLPTTAAVYLGLKSPFTPCIVIVDAPSIT